MPQWHRNDSPHLRSPQKPLRMKTTVPTSRSRASFLSPWKHLSINESIMHIACSSKHVPRSSLGKDARKGVSPPEIPSTLDTNHTNTVLFPTASRESHARNDRGHPQRCSSFPRRVAFAIVSPDHMEVTSPLCLPAGHWVTRYVSRSTCLDFERISSPAIDSTLARDLDFETVCSRLD